MKKKGLSPVITTVILIALVIAIIAVVFFWFRGMVEEGVTKFGKNIQLVCEDVSFDASYDSGTLNIVNQGNIPLYTLNVKSSSGGIYTTKEINDFSGVEWPTAGLKQGATFSEQIELSGEVELIPILIGTSRTGKKTFVCGGEYGKKISI